MTKTIIRFAAITTLLAITACGTINGLGRDISNAGNAISNASS